MKKRSAILFFIFFFSITAQTQIYIGASCGYHLPALKEYLANLDEQFADGSGVNKRITSSFGKGIQPEFTIGYQKDSALSFEIQSAYLLGSTIRMNNIYIGNGIYGYFPPADNIASMIRISPAVKFSIGKKIFNYYLLAGPVIGIGTKTELIVDNPYGYGTNTQIRAVYDGGISWGVRSSAGLEWKITPGISAHCRFDGIFQNWSPEHYKINSYSIDGTDQLPLLDNYYKEAYFSEKISGTAYADQPRHSMKFSLPFSSYGISLGISYRFGTAKAKPSKTESDEIEIPN